MDHEKCPRCGGRSVRETFNPPRKGNEPNLPGDIREAYCTAQGCGWRSKAIYKKGRSPHHPCLPTKMDPCYGYWEWEVPSLNADRKKGLTRK